MPDMIRRNGIDLLKVFHKFLKNWWLFVFSVGIAVVIVKVKDKYEVPIYSLSTRLMSETRQEPILQQDGTNTFIQSNPVENQLALLESNSQIEKIIRKLDFGVSYYAVGKLRTVEVYHASPFLVYYDTLHAQPWGKEIHFTVLSHEEVEIKTDPPIGGLNGVFRVGDTIKSDRYKFNISWKPYVNNNEFAGNQYMFTINSFSSLVFSYRWKLDIYYDNSTSIITISTTGRNIDKEVNFLNMLVSEYMKINLQLKTQTIDNTIAFIDKQLNDIGLSLKNTEDRLETFRQNNDMMTLQDKTIPLLERINSLSKNKADKMMELRYYEYLRDYIVTHDNIDDIVSPSTVGITLPLFSDILGELSDNYLLKEDLLATTTPENPVIINLETKIANQKKLLIENISNIVHITQLKIDDFERRIEENLAQYSQLPGLESEYMNIQRYYNLDNTMYNFLLQKRAEAEIQKSSTVSDLILLDKASAESAWKISPNSKSNLSRAVILAILVPAAFLFLLIILDKKIYNSKELLQYTGLPSAGKIPHNKSRSSFLVREQPRSFFTQSLRLVMANLPFNREGKGRTILVTSSVSGEGKTFVSLNLALVYAASGKKVLLADFDFQHPSLSKIFKDNPESGLVHTDTENLDLLLPGIASTAADKVLQSTGFADLIEDLKKQYDYMIFDSAPLGLLADSFYLSRFADITLYVVRHRKTPLPVLDNILQNILEKGKLPGVCFVYNDARFRMPVTEQKYYGMIEKTGVVDEVIRKIRDQMT